MKENLTQAIQDECNRVRGLIEVYNTVPMGYLAASFMAQSIAKAEDAISTGDTIGMILAYKDLQAYTW